MPLLIGVGGSGQHVALAAARLARLGAWPRSDALLLDADQGSELTRELLTFGGLASPGDHPLGTVEIVAPLPPELGPQATFGELFVEPGAGPSPLFEAFFDAASAGVQVQRGMFGNPAVGATVFGHFAGERMDGVLHKAARATAIGVTGSFVGGTGAGLQHALLRSLAGRGLAGRTALVGLLPWHEAPAHTAGEQPLSEGSMSRNALFGAEYLFATSRHFAQSSALIGVPAGAPPWLSRVSVKEGRNAEYPHPLHAFACYLFLVGAEAAVVSDRRGAVNTLVLDPDDRGWLLRQPWQGGVSLARRAQRARGKLALLRFLASAEPQFRSTFNWIGGAARDTYSAALVDSLKANKAPSRPPAAMVAPIWADFAREAAQLEHALDWLRGLFGEEPAPDALRAIEAAPQALVRTAADAPRLPEAGAPASPAQLSAWFSAALDRALAARLP